MEVARVTYNNMVDDKNYVITKKEDTEMKDEGYKSVLPLVKEILSKLDRSESSGRGNKTTYQVGDHDYKPWRFENPDNKSTKEINGTILK